MYCIVLCGRGISSHMAWSERQSGAGKRGRVLEGVRTHYYFSAKVCARGKDPVGTHQARYAETALPCQARAAKPAVLN